MDDKSLDALIRVLNAGGIIAYPTEAVFGLGCDPDNPLALQQLLALKQRSADKGLILLAADFVQLEPYLLPLEPEVQARVLPTWPGPVTWVLPARPHVSTGLRGSHAFLAVRVTAHPWCREFCLKWGRPIVSTSANRSGELPARSVAEVRQQFGDALAAVVDAPLGNQAQPTTIRHGLSGEVLRPC